MPDPPGDLVPVRAGHVTVEDRDVLAVEPEQVERLVTVRSDVDDGGIGTQPGPHGLPDVLVVLDDEYPHDPSPGSLGRPD